MRRPPLGRQPVGNLRCQWYQCLGSPPAPPCDIRHLRTFCGQGYRETSTTGRMNPSFIDLNAMGADDLIGNGRGFADGADFTTSSASWTMSRRPLGRRSIEIAQQDRARVVGLRRAGAESGIDAGHGRCGQGPDRGRVEVVETVLRVRDQLLDDLRLPGVSGRTPAGPPMTPARRRRARPRAGARCRRLDAGRRRQLPPPRRAAP